MYIQKDTFKQNYNQYIKSEKDATKINYKDLPEPKTNKEATNLILNQRTASLKNAPIQISDKKQAPVINPYNNFKGATILPTFKKDLKLWHIC